MPYLCAHTFNGKEYISAAYDKHREPRLGEYEYVEITDEQAEMTLEALAAWRRERRKPNPPETVRMKRSELLKRLADIIRQSHHEGERENARTLYLKYAGKPFEG